VTQLGLDLTPPRTHAGDPASSHRAEERMRKSGRLSLQQRIVLNCVRNTPGKTASQLSILLDHHPGSPLYFDFGGHERLCQVRRRLSDLRAMGKVRRHHTAGQRESRWFATGE
jgi:hypothetical protein